MRYVIGLIVIALMAGVVYVIAGRDDNQKNTNPPPPTTNQTTNNEATNNPPASQTPEVSISNFAFSPTDITVKKGTKVTWTNNDSVAHTVTADSGKGPDSELLQNGQTYSFTFNEVGTFNYHCTPHPQMHGTVTVTE
jgi:amicyanin